MNQNSEMLVQKNPVSRNKKGKIVHHPQKKMIISIFKHLQQENMDKGKPRLSNCACAQMISETTGIGSVTIRRTLKEYHEHGYVSTPKYSRKRNKSISKLLDDSTKCAIRKKVHDFFHKNELPTINKVLSAINDDADLPNFCRTTLYKILHDNLEFRYVKRGNNAVLMERDDLVCLRRSYLRRIRKYRALGKTVYYTDETCINVGHTMKHTMKEVWADNKNKSVQDASLDGSSTGPKNSNSEGNRLIIFHIGNEEGFVPNSWNIIESKNSGDYHQEITPTVYEEWLVNMLPKLEQNAVIVLDNAAYHCRRLDEIPTVSWSKDTIVEWLNDREIAADMSNLKVELLAKVRNLKCDPVYAVDEIIRNTGREILRLPPYHCTLNAMELIWADIKQYVCCRNTTFNLQDVKKLVIDAIETITTDRWNDCVQYVIDKAEAEMWTIDELTENEVEPMIITNSDDESDEEFHV